MVICSVFDSVSGLYARPAFVASKGVARRMFSDEVNRMDKDNALNGHSEDFGLYYLGVFDDETGLFVGAVPEVLCLGLEVKL
jgi:hypothetical protein